MPLVFEQQLNSSGMNFEDFLCYLDNEVAFTSEQSILTILPKVQNLALDQDFLFRKLLNWKGANSSLRRGYSAQVDVLAEGKDYVIRSVIWPPRYSQLIKEQALERGYTDPHDHNFSFLTVGYYGPGYLTEVYDNDYNDVKGWVGEPVNLKNRQLIQLSPGRVLYFRSSVDTHVQFPPVSYSISLNVLPKVPLNKRNRQNFFDYDKQELTRSMRPYPVDLLFQLACFTQDNELRNELTAIAESHYLPEIRLSAYEALLKSSDGETVEICKRSACDPSPYLQSNLSKLPKGDIHL